MDISKELNLGRLKSAGVDEPWKVPLYLPTSFMDCRVVYERFDIEFNDAQRVVVIGRYCGDFVTEWRKGNTPLSRGSLIDARGNSLKFSLFGDSRAFKACLIERPERIVLAGTIALVHGRPYLNDPILLEGGFLGKIIPQYPGVPKVLSPTHARKLIAEMLPATIRLAAAALRDHLNRLAPGRNIREIVKCREWTLEQVLSKAHYPASLEECEAAHHVLERVAALISVHDLRQSCAAPRVDRVPLECPDLDDLLIRIPLSLTEEQISGIRQLIYSFMQPHTSVTLINGDVGMGKSIIYQVAVAAAVMAGGRAAVLLPNERLAAQAFDEINMLWPELCPVLVNSKSSKDLIQGRLLIGTTALLCRETGCLDVCVIDEQHRFSVDQRQRLANERTHLIEISATPIPRTQAMIMYGSASVIRLTKRHCDQDIHTRIVTREGAREMVDYIRSMIADGSRLLIVCPRKDQYENPDDGSYRLPSVHHVAAKWERLFPGKVRVIHSDTPEDDAKKALSDVESGSAPVLVSTTVIECGLNIRGLRVLVVVHAERFGISQLHQIRGRLSRHGGYGMCYLYLPHPVKDATMARLRAVASTNDGMKLAEMDMDLRGFGDLSRAGLRQHGAATGIIFNKEVSSDLLREMVEMLS